MEIEDLLKKRGKIIPNKTPLSVEVRKSIFMLIFTLFSIILLFSIVYFLNSSQANQKGYFLKQQQVKKDNLIDLSREWINKTIEVQSYRNIENHPIVQTMIKPDNTIFIEKEKTE